jgi:hypothetical protein
MTKPKSAELTHSYLFCAVCLCERRTGPDRLIVNHNRFDADVLDEVSDGVFIGSMIRCPGSGHEGMQGDEIDESHVSLHGKVA